MWLARSTCGRRQQCRLRSGRAQKLEHQRRCGVGCLEWGRVAGAGHDPKAARAGKPCGISVAVGAPDHAIVLARDHQRRHGGAREPLAQRAAIEIGRLEAHERPEAEHLIAAHLLVEVATSVREEAQRGRRVSIAEQERAQRRVVDAAFGLCVHEHVADRLARHKQAAGSDQDEPRYLLRMTDGKLGCDPAANAVADEIKALQRERVEDFEIMEHDVVDAAAVELIAASAARMRRRDDPGDLGEPLMEGLEIAGNAVYIGKAVEIDKRRAGACFQHRNLAAAYVENPHFAISGWRSLSGNAGANSFAESTRNRGATSVANRRMLSRVSASGMLPRWNWIKRCPTLACSRISRMRACTLSALPTMIEADCLRSSQFSASPRSGEVGSENFR